MATRRSRNGNGDWEVENDVPGGVVRCVFQDQTPQCVFLADPSAPPGTGDSISTTPLGNGQYEVCLYSEDDPQHPECIIVGFPISDPDGDPDNPLNGGDPPAPSPPAPDTADGPGTPLDPPTPPASILTTLGGLTGYQGRVVSLRGSGTDWDAADAARQQDGINATTQLSGSETKGLVVQDFGFLVPPGATLDTVDILLTRQNTAALGVTNEQIDLITCGFARLEHACVFGFYDSGFSADTDLTKYIFATDAVSRTTTATDELHAGFFRTGVTGNSDMAISTSSNHIADRIHSTEVFSINPVEIREAGTNFFIGPAVANSDYAFFFPGESDETYIHPSIMIPFATRTYSDLHSVATLDSLNFGGTDVVLAVFSQEETGHLMTLNGPNERLTFDFATAVLLREDLEFYPPGEDHVLVAFGNNTEIGIIRGGRESVAGVPIDLTKILTFASDVVSSGTAMPVARYWSGPSCCSTPTHLFSFGGNNDIDEQLGETRKTDFATISHSSGTYLGTYLDDFTNTCFSTSPGGLNA